MAKSAASGPGDGTGRRPAGALEQEVLAALWASPAPLTPAAVQAEGGADTASTNTTTSPTLPHKKRTMNQVR